MDISCRTCAAAVISGGEYGFLRRELEEGYDSVEGTRRRPGRTGGYAMGVSDLASVQWFVAK